MPLTVRTNGSSSPNIITASWFNDFLNLLTGSMQDQIVTIKNELLLQAIGAAPSGAAGGSLASGSTLGIGLYNYVYTYANASGESLISPQFGITTTSTNQKVNLTGITVGPTGTTARKVYRTVVGGGTGYKLLTTINDNSTTTFADSIADGSLGAAFPTRPSFGGSLIVQDSTPTTQAQIFSDGTSLFNGIMSLIAPLSPNTAITTVNGSVGGLVQFATPIWGPTLKIFFGAFSGGYKNANTVNFVLPSTINKLWMVWGNVGATYTVQVKVGGTAQTITIIAGLGGAGAGTVSAQTAMHGLSMGIFEGNNADTIAITPDAATAMNTLLFGIGF